MLVLATSIFLTLGFDTSEIGAIFKYLDDHVRTDRGSSHCHDDLGMAVANITSPLSRMELMEGTASMASNGGKCCALEVAVAHMSGADFRVERSGVYVRTAPELVSVTLGFLKTRAVVVPSRSWDSTKMEFLSTPEIITPELRWG